MLKKAILAIFVLSLLLNGYLYSILQKEIKISAGLNQRIEHLRGIISLQISRNRSQQEQLYSSSSKDKNGNLPSDVLNEYLQAKINNDYATTYRLLQVPSDINYERYCEELKGDTSILISYQIEDYILRSEESAVVFLTHETRFRNITFYYDWEPWACMKENDVWKVRWLARQ
ncbi:MAG TPA: hypothetical protein DCZ10_19200 [Pelotomaculum sp.]|nr:hypothetical protein [Pelotomaculum sp.]